LTKVLTVPSGAIPISTCHRTWKNQSDHMEIYMHISIDQSRGGYIRLINSTIDSKISVSKFDSKRCKQNQTKQKFGKVWSAYINFGLLDVLLAARPGAAWTWAFARNALTFHVSNAFQLQVTADPNYYLHPKL
jgi:hypothetical protein